MLIFVASDLHLEIRKLRVSDVVNDDAIKQCDILVLAGDIGNPFDPVYDQFISECAFLFPRVVVIAGNHEYYNTSGIKMNQVEKQIDYVCDKFSNVVFLNRRAVSVDGIEIIGAVLWTNIPDSCAQAVKNGLNDYRFIYNNEGSVLRVDDVNHIFQYHLEFIRQSIIAARTAGRRILVVTHHVPLNKGTSNPVFEYEGNKTNTAFTTDLNHYLGKDAVDVWVCGHTHWSFDHNVRGTRIISNQYGYGMNPHQRYRKGLLIEI